MLLLVKTIAKEVINLLALEYCTFFICLMSWKMDGTSTIPQFMAQLSYRNAELCCIYKDLSPTTIFIYNSCRNQIDESVPKSR
jgi:hypothetical protein